MIRLHPLVFDYTLFIIIIFNFTSCWLRCISFHRRFECRFVLWRRFRHLMQSVSQKFPLQFPDHFILIIDHLNLCFRNCSKHFSLYVTTQNVTTSFNLLIRYKSLFQFSRFAKVCFMSLELIYPFMKYHLLVRQMYIWSIRNVNDLYVSLFKV